MYAASQSLLYIGEVVYYIAVFSGSDCLKLLICFFRLNTGFDSRVHHLSYILLFRMFRKQFLRSQTDLGTTQVLLHIRHKMTNKSSNSEK